MLRDKPHRISHLKFNYYKGRIELDPIKKIECELDRINVFLLRNCSAGQKKSRDRVLTVPQLIEVIVNRPKVHISEPEYPLI
jgi:hypothetical protein